MRLGMNLPPCNYWQTDDKFVDLLNPISAYYPPRKTDPGWTWDANGWPKTMPVGGPGYGWILPATVGKVSPGTYVISAKGKGKLFLGHNDFAAGPWMLPTATDDQDHVLATFDIKTQGVQVLAGVFESDPANPLRDVRFHRADQDPAQIFPTYYVDELTGFDTLRLMQWADISGYNRSTTWPVDGPGSDVRRWAAGIELANRCGANLWVCIPHTADPGYIAGLAKLIDSTFRKDRKVYLEYSNECWNWGPPFAVETDYVNKWGAAQTPPINNCEALSELSHRAFEAFHAAAPGLTSVVRVLAQQCFNDYLAQLSLDYADKKGYKFDALSCAPYFGPVKADTTESLDWTTLDALWGGDASHKAQAVTQVVQAYRNSFTDPAILPMWAVKYRALADQHGIDLIAYECGPSWAIGNPAPAGRQDLYDAVQHSPELGQAIGEYFTWMSKYFTMGCYYCHTSPWGPNQQWGTRQYVGEPSPKADACRAWLSAPPISVSPTPTPTPVIPMPDPTPTPTTPTPTPVSVVAIPDAGFEQQTMGSGNFQYGPTGSAWSFVGAGISAAGSGFTAGDPPAPEGVQVAFLQGHGSFTQAVDGWPAGSYVLGFKAAQRGSNQASRQDFAVSVDGSDVGTFTPSGTSYQSYMTGPFTVTAGKHTIAFRGLNTAGGDNTAFVDQIAVAAAQPSVTPVPTPTPVTPTPTPLPDPTPTPTPVTPTPTPPDPTPTPTPVTPTPTPPTPDPTPTPAPTPTEQLAALQVQVADARTHLQSALDLLAPPPSKPVATP